MKDKVFSIRNLWRRLTSESPAYFKKLRWLMVTIGGLGIAIEAIIKISPSFFPETSMYVSAVPHLLGIGALGTFLTSLTVKDNVTSIRPN